MEIFPKRNRKCVPPPSSAYEGRGYMTALCRLAACKLDMVGKSNVILYRRQRCQYSTEYNGNNAVETVSR